MTAGLTVPRPQDGWAGTTAPMREEQRPDRRMQREDGPVASFPPTLDGLWRLELVKLASAEATAPAAGRLRRAVRFAAASLLASGALAATALRVALESAPLPEGDAPDLLCAMHGERSTRTQHLLGALREAGAPRGPLLILGRPRAGLPEIEAMLAAEGIDGVLPVRPFGPREIVESLLAAAPALRAGWRALREAPGEPELGELMALTFRVLLGRASARWWVRSGLRPRCVVYAHTGLADTTALEMAQQRAGAQTVHWAHGLSVGVNFVGHSNVGLFQCGHDARWHARMGGYQRTPAPASPRPTPRPPGSGWVLLSNLAHPMNPWFQRFGPRLELELLDLVADAAALTGTPASDVVWKPHPVFASLAPPVRAEIEAKVRARGLSSWPAGAPLAKAAESAVVLSTASTTAIDMLRLGVAPVIVPVEPIVPGTAISRFPLIARNAAELADAVRRTVDPAERRALFETAWAEIGPGNRPSLESIAELATRPEETTPT